MRAPLLSRSHRRRRRLQFPITVFFDGDASTYFPGGWSEVGGNVLNDQIVLGSELVDNGNFAAWTGDDPDGWTVIGEVGADPEVSEVGAGQGHGGAGNGLCNFYQSATAGQPRIDQAGKVTVGIWHRLIFVLDTLTAGTFQAHDSVAAIRTFTSAASYITGFRGIVGTKLLLRALAANSDVTIDDVSLKVLTFASLMNVLKSQFGIVDGFFIDVYINAVTVGNPVGVLWNYDGSNNFGMAYMDGVTIMVDKNVAGTYSNLASVGQAVTPDQILRIENPAGSNVLDILYNGVSKATPTIADASVIGNTGIALFSTEANNAISKVVIGKL